jgi:hypothetical protein
MADNPIGGGFGDSPGGFWPEIVVGSGDNGGCSGISRLPLAAGRIDRVHPAPSKRILLGAGMAGRPGRGGVPLDEADSDQFVADTQPSAERVSGRGADARLGSSVSGARDLSPV